MKLVIHAGLHKTATTAFQIACRSLSRQLMDSHVYYPVIDDFTEQQRKRNPVYPDFRLAQHWMVPWEAQFRNYESLEAILKKAQQLLPPQGVVLLSSENFANVLVEPDIAIDIERTAADYGVTDVLWAFVLRRPFEYFESVYSELCKNNAFFTYEGLANIVLRKGYFTMQAPQWDVHFVFDYGSYIARLKKKIKSKIWQLDMADFVRPVPGMKILEACNVDSGQLSNFQKFLDSSPPYNERLDPYYVEAIYLSHFMGLSGNEDGNLEGDALAAVNCGVAARLARIAAVRDEVKQKFDRRFGEGVLPVTD